MSQDISKLYSKYKNSKKSCIILGCGLSAKNFVEHSNIFTIGVNDIGLLINPNVLLLVDSKKKFEKDAKNKNRIKNIENTKADYYVVLDSQWNFPTDKKYFFKLGLVNNMRKNLRNNDKLNYAQDSPYIATNLAHKLGFKLIGFLGIDYTPHHFYTNDGDHQLIKLKYEQKIQSHYVRLRDALKLYGCEMYNLSEKSIIRAFPKISYKEFINKTLKL